MGDVEELAVGGPTGFGLLQWDESRKDKRLEISQDGHGMKHIGPTGKATSMSTTGFANGRNLWRILPNGCKEGEWVSLGVCTAGLIGSAAYAQDSVIFSFTPDTPNNDDTSDTAAEQHLQVGSLSMSKKKNVKYEVSPGDIIAVSLDCATGSVEYYKNSICIKTAMLFAAATPKPESSDGSGGHGSRTSTGSRLEDEDGGGDGAMTPRKRNRKKEMQVVEEICWYPFATLYEKGQSVRFDKVGDGH